MTKKEDIKKQFSELYKDYAPQMSSALRRLYGDGPPDPDDVAQQAFQNVMQRGDHSTIRNIKAFLWRTARNIVLAAKRTHVLHSGFDYEVENLFFPLKDVDITPENIISVRQQLAAVNECLKKMPEKRRRAFMLHRVEGLSLTETGRRLGISRTTVAQHIARAAADLDLLLTDDLQG